MELRSGATDGKVKAGVTPAPSIKKNAKQTKSIAKRL
jgi:hypothetical protein